jgi:hypothetical protein
VEYLESDNTELVELFYMDDGEMMAAPIREIVRNPSPDHPILGF